ncbi:MAG TPA: NrfD/PsrC family molybdoenzyme membrane anchor subunit [Dehalococcoidia bacterium]|nr:NrfD/PsrC family molybdoenzyme membrane anchor subunit [Dehalococcoidia bacterium]
MSALAMEKEQLNTVVLRPVLGVPRTYYVVMAVLLGLVVLAFVAWVNQLMNGLAVTGMWDRVSWGLYITNFVFFIGISHAGTLISAILRVTQAGWRRPITRMAEVITAVALLTGAAMPVVDLGRPDRIPNLILHGQIGSPIVWDLISVTTYLTASLIYLYTPMIPDLARCRDRLRGLVPYPQWKVYDILSLGWQNTPEQRRRLSRALNIMMILIIPIAVSVHTVVSWIFAMTLRAGWDSTIFGPYFVVGAIFSGTAAIITAMAVFRRIFHLEQYITIKQFRLLGYLLGALAAIYLYFTLAEYLTTGYKLEEGEKPLLEELMLGRFAPFFWSFAIGGTLIPLFLVFFPRTQTVPWIVAASVLVNIGMWLKRFVIVIPSMGVPLMPYEWATYHPSWVEVSITVGAFAGFMLLFALFARLFPIVSIWEVEEMLEEGGEEAAEQPRPVAAPAFSFAEGGEGGA